MSRIYKSLLALACLVIWCGAAFGASTPKYRMRDKTRPTVDARSHVLPQSNAGRSFGAPRSVGAASNANAKEMGKTYYDFQHNASTGRQVDEFNGKVEVSWMKSPGPSVSVRTVNWNRTNVTGPVGSVNSGYLPLNIPLLSDGQAFEAVRPGYTNTRMRTGGKNVTIYHDAPESGGVQFWEARLDLTAGAGIFAGLPSPSPNAPGNDHLVDGVIWPKSAISTCGADQVHHAIGMWSGGSLETWYWRGIINDLAGSISWAAFNGGLPKMIDPVVAGVSSVVEAKGSDVTIAMGKQVNTTNADLVYYRSTDCGLTWGPMVNVTGYSATGPEGFFAECNAVYDVAGNVHLIWNTSPANGSDAPVNLWHWSTATGIRLITSAGWTNTCVGGTVINIGANNGAGSGNLAIAEPTLSVKPAGVHGAFEQLYAIWTQYGPTDTDCATVDATELGGHVNGEIYVSVSTNFGLTWDRPQNVTKTQSPDCTPGNCVSESWVTAAATADSGLYLSYVDDTHGGPAIQGGGTWSESPYMALAPEARAAVLEPVIAVSPIKFIELNADPVGGGQAHSNLSIISVGNDNLTYTVNVTNVGGGASHVTVNGGPSASNTILAGGAPQVIDVAYDAVGLGNPTEHNWQLSVTSNDPQNDPGQSGSPILVDLQVFAANPWYTCTEDTLSTGTHRMQVSPCLEMGDRGTDGLGFYNYADSAEWMYTGSPVIALIRAGDTLAYHNAFMGLSDRTRLQNKSFRAQGPMTVVRNTSITVGDSTFFADRAFGLASTTDTTIQINYEILFPRKPNLANGYVYKLSMKSNTGSPISGVHYGVAADLDVDPSAGENAGAGSDPKGWIGAVGGESDTASNFTPNTKYIALFHVPQGSSCTRNGAVAGQVLANPNYVVPDGAYNVDSLHKLFKTFGQLGSWGTNIHVDTGQQFDDVSAMLVSGYNQTLSNATFTNFAYGVAVTDVSVGDLEATIEALRSSLVPACQVACLIVIPGDVNFNGSITSADIITLVNYVFKGGPVPQPCQANGDVNCNGSVTSADIISLVNFVFKGGTPPCDICASGTPLVAGCN